MRITQSMTSNSMMNNLQLNYRKMDKIQEQMATQRRLNRPSDDPIGVASALQYRSEISSTTQFTDNVEDANSWMTMNDTVMTETTQIVQRLAELAVEGGTETVPADARKNIAEEVDQLYQQLVSLGNSQFKGKYIFNGDRVNEQPYPSDPANEAYNLDQGEVQYQVGAGIYIGVNTIGDNIFGDSGDASGLFRVVDDMRRALNNDDTTGIQAAVPALQKSLENIIITQAVVGGKQNRLEFTLSRLEDLNSNYVSLQSSTEDADITKVVTDLQTAENVYNSSLNAMSRIIQPSLLDFLS